jgi:hypothetical protein
MYLISGKKTRAGLAYCTVFAGAIFAFQAARAYDIGVEADLKYSRDALLKQRGEIQLAVARKTAQIAESQSEVDRLQAYLQDTDRALRNVDLALRGN